MRHWARDPALRSWPVLLLIALVCVPPIALVLLNNGTESALHSAAWIFAFYFAVAWLLLLGVIVRPQHVSRSMLAAVAVIGIVTQAPTAIFLETQLHSSTGSLLDVFTIGIPEELAKAIPIVAVAWIWRQYWQTQTPRDYLFLGAVSGLLFGAAEAVHYFDNVLGSLSGNITDPTLQALTLEFVWRFLTDPIDHAMWAGITGYFIGLAITGPYRKYSIGLVGIGIAAVLHGLNDWNLINSHLAWVLVTLISVLLFLGYARAGAWLPQQALASPRPAPSQSAPSQSAPSQPAPSQSAPSQPAPSQSAPHASPGPPSGPWAASPPAHTPPPPPRRRPRPAGYGHPRPAGYGAPTGQGSPAGPGVPAPSAGPPRPGEAWWQRAPAAGAGPVPAPPPTHGSSGPPSTVQRKPAPKPWWEQ